MRHTERAPVRRAADLGAAVAEERTRDALEHAFREREHVDGIQEAERRQRRHGARRAAVAAWRARVSTAWERRDHARRRHRLRDAPRGVPCGGAADAELV